MQLQQMREQLDTYINYLALQELSPHTLQKYRRDIRLFIESLPTDRVLEKQVVSAYREKLMSGHKAVSVNTSIIALNRFFSWLNHPELCVKTIRIQRQTGHEHIITRQEYARLLEYCLCRHKQRDYLLLRTLAATGMRVGELGELTYQTALSRCAQIRSKGKLRTVFIPEQLAALLVDYCAQIGVAEGPIFLGRSRLPLQPGSVWRMMKRAAAQCDVDPQNAYPHSLRHLFAKTYMQKIGNIFELADLLGHSSIETTRIYALSSHDEKRKAINTLEL